MSADLQPQDAQQPNLQQRTERLIALGDRLTKALCEDIAQLEKGQIIAIQLAGPEMQQLTLLYSREARCLDMNAAQRLAADQRNLLAQSTARVKDALSRHQRLAKRIGSASEGMVRAIAEEVGRKRATQRSYAPHRPRSAPAKQDAMIYNSIA